MTRYREQMAALTAWKGAEEGELNARARAKLLKLTLQKITPEIDTEHFFGTFEQIRDKNGW